MTEAKIRVDCPKCGNRDTVMVTKRDGRYSKSIKISKCEVCGDQSGVKSILNSKSFSLK